MGYLYQRGETYWIKYYRNGKPYRESCKTTEKGKAERILKKREGEIADGKIPGIYFDRVKFDDLAKILITDYTINGKDSLKRVVWSIDCLKESFEGMKAPEITTDKIQAHIEKRMRDGLSNASINRELAVLKRMFHLGAQCTPPKVALIPHIPMLKESNTRKGFFEADEYLALKNALPYYLKPVIMFAYHTAWRAGEILSLTWDKVDLKQGTITLNPGETKGEEGRTIYMDNELLKEMKSLHSNRHLGCPLVFHHNGKPIKRITRSWGTACIKAGLCEPKRDENGEPITKKIKRGKVKEKVIMVPTKIFHDFRRTAVRNMVRAGIPERVAMMVSGHKTRSVFERYNIVSDQDLKEAARKIQTYHEKSTGVIGIQENKRGEVVQFKEAQNG
jgi:integrase